MILGKVCGSINSTINHEFYDNKKLMVVDRLDSKGKASGKYLIAVDAVGAGVGETVLVIDEGNSARQILKVESAPIRSLIIGIIDQWEVNSG